MRVRLFASLLLMGALLPLSLPALAAADEEDDLDALQQKLTNEWYLVKNDRRHNIKSWVKQEDGKRYRSFKVEAVLQGSMESCVRILLDFGNYPKWYWEVIDSRLIRKSSATDYYVYLKHRAPHGLPDRDAPVLMRFEPQTPDNRSLSLRVKAIPDMMPDTPRYIRMQAEDMYVRLTPTPEKTVIIQAEGYVDPGGRVPGWAINYIQRSAPYAIVVGLQRMMRLTGEHRERSPLPFKVDEQGIW